MAVPTGFTLDQSPQLPPGFTLDTADPTPRGPVRSKPKSSLTGSEQPKKSTSGQIADLMEGTAGVMTGSSLPLPARALTVGPAILANPLGAVAGLAGGYVVGKGAKAGAEALGATPDQSRLAEDIGEAGGAALGGKYGSRAIRSLEPIVPNRVTEIPKWTVEKLSAIKQRFNELGSPTPKAKYGPDNPRPAPGWASSTPATAAPEAEPLAPTPTELPSGRPVGSLQRVKELGLDLPAPPPKGHGPKLVSWQRMQAQGNAPAPEASPEKLPAPTSLPSGRKPGSIASQSVPATPAPVAAPAVNPTRTAAELMKAIGITPDSMVKATPEQWKMIEQHAGGPVDRQAALAYLKASTPASQATGDVAANRAARGLAPTEVAVTPDQARTPIRTRRR